MQDLINKNQETQKKSHIQLKISNELNESSNVINSNLDRLDSPLISKIQNQTQINTIPTLLNVKNDNIKFDAEKNNSGISKKCFYGSNSKPSNTTKNVSSQNESSVSILDVQNDSPISSKRRKMNAPNENTIGTKNTTEISRALTPRRGLTPSNSNNNSNFNSKNPKFDQENLENTSKNGSSSAVPLNNNGSIKTWNRNNSNKSLGKG